MTAYREGPRVLLCPRCGEMLERVLDGMNACVRCEGIWLTQRMLDKAFGTPRWPTGPSAWWRRALECPECAGEGRTTAMSPVMANDVLVDRCNDHGTWLDQGELGRLTGAPPSIELEAFHQFLRPDVPLPPQIVARREARQAEVARREAELAAYRAKLAQDREREETAKHAVERRRLEGLRGEAEAVARVSERALLMLREQVRAKESTLADERGRILEIQRKLDELDA